MIHVAICLSCKEASAYIEQELLTFSRRRNLDLSTFMIHDPSELHSRNFILFQPDILIVSMDHVNQPFSSFYNYLKSTFSSLVTILHDSNTKDKSLLGKWTHPVIPCQGYERKELWRAYHHAFSLIQDDDSSIIFYRRPQYVSKPLCNVLYFASEARRIHMFSIDEEETFYYKMNDLEEYLQTKNYSFIRIHQSYLVNISYIQRFDRYSIQLRSGEELKISSFKRYKELLSVMQTKPELTYSL